MLIGHSSSSIPKSQFLIAAAHRLKFPLFDASEEVLNTIVRHNNSDGRDDAHLRMESIPSPFPSFPFPVRLASLSHFGFNLRLI